MQTPKERNGGAEHCVMLFDLHSLLRLSRFFISFLSCFISFSLSSLCRACRNEILQQERAEKAAAVAEWKARKAAREEAKAARERAVQEEKERVQREKQEDERVSRRSILAGRSACTDAALALRSDPRRRNRCRRPRLTSLCARSALLFSHSVSVVG